MHCVSCSSEDWNQPPSAWRWSPPTSWVGVERLRRLRRASSLSRWRESSRRQTTRRERKTCWASFWPGSSRLGWPTFCSAPSSFTTELSAVSSSSSLSPGWMIAWGNLWNLLYTFFLVSDKKRNLHWQRQLGKNKVRHCVRETSPGDNWFRYHCEFSITKHEAVDAVKEKMVENSSLTDLLHLSMSTTAESELSSLPSSQSDLKKLNKENLSVAVR